MDKELFMSEVKDWLVETGKVKELQTKLRADLIKAITNTRGLKVKPATAAVSATSQPADCALDLLVMEHLMTRKFWYASSVLASEADFGRFNPPNIEETCLVGNKSQNKNAKSQHPVKFSTQEVHSVMGEMLQSGQMPDQGFTDTVYGVYCRDRRVSLLQTLVKRFFQDFQLASKPVKANHATGVQTHPGKESATKSTQTKDNLLTEIQDAREQIDRLNEENRQLRARLEQELQAKFDRLQRQPNRIGGSEFHHINQPGMRIEGVQSPDYLAGAQDFVARMRDKLTDLSTSNQQIMNTVNHR